MMDVFINGIGNISPQHTVDKSLLINGADKLSGNRYHCIEPDYSQFVDSKQIRRMSRVIKMGVASSSLAMKEAGIKNTDAIIVGTSFGCLEDTYSFLSKMVQYKEEMLSPTAFIHSTHNSIAAQIALLFQCKNYNSTYVHRNISFESALIDAMLMLNDGSIDNALVGGIDETTDVSFDILNRLHSFKDNDVNADNFYAPGKGSVAGEGSAFFVLDVKKNENSYSKIKDVQTFSFNDISEVKAAAETMLMENNIASIDLLIAGNNGDESDDLISEQFVSSINMQHSTFKYKHLCGEYGTASAFALYIAAEILKDNSAAEKYGYQIKKEVKNILIYNQLKEIHHSLILLTVC